MSKHMMALAFAAFISVSAGCTSIINIPIESAKIHQSKIAAVALKSQDTLTFDQRGGSYDQKNNIIIGATLERTPVSVKPIDVSEVQLREDTGLVLAQTRLSMKAYGKSILDIAGRRIMGIVLVSDSAIDFGNNGGILDSGRRIITGYDKKHHSVVERPFDDICCLRIKKFNLFKTYLMTGLTVGAALSIYCIITGNCDIAFDY